MCVCICVCMCVYMYMYMWVFGCVCAERFILNTWLIWVWEAGRQPKSAKPAGSWSSRGELLYTFGFKGSLEAGSFQKTTIIALQAFSWLDEAQPTVWKVSCFTPTIDLNVKSYLKLPSHQQLYWYLTKQLTYKINHHIYSFILKIFY